MDEYTFTGVYHEKPIHVCRGCGQKLFYNQKENVYYCPVCNVEYDE